MSLEIRNNSSTTKEKEMNRFSYLKFTAVVAVLAMALVGFMRTSTATNQPLSTPSLAPGVDLSNEERALGRYFDDLVAHDKEVATLGKRARLVSTDLDAIQRKSDDLKSGLPGVQNVFREIIRKLKAANEWDNLDTSIAANITDQRERSFLLSSSFKDLLEDGANNLASHKDEISLPVTNLRKRLTSRYDTGGEVRFVRAGYEAPAPIAFYSVKCSIGVGKLKLIKRLGGVATNATLQSVFEACHAPGTPSPF